MDALDEFLDIAHSIAWCSVATVDRRGRPRSRILHPVWERDGDGLTGWIGTTATALKTAHLAHAPYVSCSYWDPTHDTAQAECAASWVTGDDGLAAAWERLRSAPPPMGYDPAPIWPDGPTGEDFVALRLDPWRVQAKSAAAMAAGEPYLAWQP